MSESNKKNFAVNAERIVTVQRFRHCEEIMDDFAMIDAAIQHFKGFLDCFANDIV